MRFTYTPHIQRVPLRNAQTQRPTPITTRNVETEIPYLLTASDDHTIIYARGSRSVLHELSTVRDSRIGHLIEKGRTISYISLPASRNNVMVCEAIASPAAVHKNFIDTKNELMQVDITYRNRILAATIAGRIKRPLLYHQIQFVALAMQRRGMLNASEQGTCKTSAAIATAEMKRCKYILIVAGKHLMSQWEDELYTTIRIDTSDLIIRLESGSSDERAMMLRVMNKNTLAEHGITRVFVMTNYEILARIIAELVNYGFDALILDESWKIKSRTTQVTRAAMRIAARCSTVQLLTGTPIGNDVGDLWSQLTMVATDEEQTELGNYQEWIDTFARIENQRGRRNVRRITGARNIAELMNVMAPMYYRATKATCLDLPAKLPPERVRLALPPTVRELYDRVLEEGTDALADTFMNVVAQQAVSLRLQQIVGGFRVDGDINNQTVTELPCSKLTWLWDFVEDVLIEDHTIRTIIWCKFNLEVDRIVREMNERYPSINCVGVTGSGPHAKDDDELTHIKTSFNSRSEEGVRIIVAQIKKLAYGHNLQGGNINIAFSHTWSFVERSQWEDRTHRQGTTRAVRYIDLVAPNTIDVDILAATDHKADLSGRLTPDTVKG